MSMWLEGVYALSLRVDSHPQQEVGEKSGLAIL